MKNTTGKNIQKEAKTIKSCYELAQTLDHPFRQQILGFLMAGTALSVSQMIAKTKLTKRKAGNAKDKAAPKGKPIDQSIMSQHLAPLRRFKLVKTERDGKNIYYSLNRERYNEVMSLFKKLNTPEA